MRKYFTFYTRIITFLVLLNFCYLQNLAIDIVNTWHYIQVSSCDPSRGLVYTDTIPSIDNPSYVPTIDLKWIEKYDMDYEVPTLYPYAYGYAKPAEGYLFTGWGQHFSYKEEIISLDNPSKFESQGHSEGRDFHGGFPNEPDDIFYAYFGKVAAQVDPTCKKYNLGTVTMDNYNNSIGDLVTLTATPSAENIYFSKWVVDGKTFSTDSIITVTASDSPRTYYAFFEYDNISSYNFADDGEWKVYYNPTLKANLPTSAIEAYCIPRCCYQSWNGTYYMLKADILKPGVPYLIYGRGKGTIEYCNFDSEEDLEFESFLKYAFWDREEECNVDGDYYLFNNNTGEFELLEEGEHLIPMGSAYIDNWQSDDKTNFKCLGHLERSYYFTLDSFYLKDYESGWEGYIGDTSYITMEFYCFPQNSNFAYKINHLIYYDTSKFYLDIIPNTPDEFIIPALNATYWFNFLISRDNDSEMFLNDYSGLVWAKELRDEVPFYADYLEDLFYIDENVKTTDNPGIIKILKDPIWGTYTMDDFYILHRKYIYDYYDENTFYKEDDCKILKHFSQIKLHKNDVSGIENILYPNNTIEYHLENGDIVFSDITNVQVYSLNGNLVRNSRTDRIEGLEKGFYIVRLADKAFKIAIR